MREVRSIYERWIGVDADKGRVQHGRDLQLDARGLAGFDAQAIDNSRRTRAIASLESRLRVATRSRSYVIAVSLDSAVPAKAKQIVEKITDFYVVDQLQAKLDANKRATEFFDDRLSELKRKVEAAERAVATYREKSGLTIGKDFDRCRAIAFGAEHAADPGARPARRPRVAARCPSAGGPQSGHAWRRYGGDGQSHDFGAASAGGRG